MINNFFRQSFAPALSLFSSFSTLICCALPALLVFLGMGASLASFISFFPWITLISKYKVEIFILAGIILSFSLILFWRDRKISCPADPKLASLCLKLRVLNSILIFISLIFYLAGVFFTFFADDLLFN